MLDEGNWRAIGQAADHVLAGRIVPTVMLLAGPASVGAAAGYAAAHNPSSAIACASLLTVCFLQGIKEAVTTASTAWLNVRRARFNAEYLRKWKEAGRPEIG